MQALPLGQTDVQGQHDVLQDVNELRDLAASCKRPRVKAMLDAYIAQLQAVVDAAAPPELAIPNESNDATCAPPNSSTLSADTGSYPSPMVKGQAPALQAKPVTPTAPPPTPVRISAASAQSSSTQKIYTSISSYGWDQDDYGKEPNNVYVYLMASFLEGIGEFKDRVECSFTESSFDLKIHDFKGKNYRLVVDLDKNIVPAESKAVVKKNKITVTLRKVKGAYGYDSWLDLAAKRRGAAKEAEQDPGAGLMDMMKQMYDEGDDQMKKTLGEAMLKSRQEQMRGGAGAGLADI